MKNGDVILLENSRFYKEEEKNDADFARKLSENADVFVNDAFGTAHRYCTVGAPSSQVKSLVASLSTPMLSVFAFHILSYLVFSCLVLSSFVTSPLHHFSSITIVYVCVLCMYACVFMDE